MLSRTMFFKKTPHRIFDYTPRFYNPLRDEQERKKRSLGFSSYRRKLRQKRNPIVWVVLLLLVIYVYLKLTGLI